MNPIGLKPRYLWEEERLHEVIGAINRYIEARKPIPIEWIEEYNDLTVNCHDNHCAKRLMKGSRIR